MCVSRCAAATHSGLSPPSHAHVPLGFGAAARAAAPPSGHHRAPPLAAARSRRSSTAAGGRSCPPAVQSSAHVDQSGRASRIVAIRATSPERIAVYNRTTSARIRLRLRPQPFRHLVSHRVHPFSQARPGDAHPLLHRAQRTSHSCRDLASGGRRSSATPSASAAPVSVPRPPAAAASRRLGQHDLFRSRWLIDRSQGRCRPPRTLAPRAGPHDGHQPTGQRAASRRSPSRTTNVANVSCATSPAASQSPHKPYAAPSTVGMKSSTIAASASWSPACAASTSSVSTPNRVSQRRTGYQATPGRYRLQCPGGRLRGRPDCRTQCSP